LYDSNLPLPAIKAKLAKQLQCLQPHIDAKDVETYQLDPFMLKPQCLDIANVYDSTSDPEAVNKAYDCTLN
jgi:hypothetical protein